MKEAPAEERAGTTRGPRTHLPCPRLWPAPGEPPPGLSLDGRGRTAAHWNHWVDWQVKKAQVKSRPLFFWHFPCLFVVVSLWCVCEYLSPIARSHLRVMGFKLGRLQEMLAQRQGREWLWGVRGRVVSLMAGMHRTPSLVPLHWTCLTLSAFTPSFCWNTP